MRIALIAVGRLGRAPEAGLARDYAGRASASGRALGLGPVEILEVESRKPGKAAEAEAIAARLEPGDHLVCCDEHGKAFASRELAARLGGLRDRGVRRTAFVIGGADGLDADLLDRAGERLAFGPQTWPHALARVMLAELVYRAVTILSGGPYHRD
jgi:23S rRNA (pseudouridine1915-N3)-methyltransferase